MASFEEIMNKPASEIQPPPAFPVGTYHCIIDGPPEFVKSSQKGTDGVRFRYRIMSPLEDVDQAAYMEGQVAGKTIQDDVWVTDGSAWRLKDLLVENLGISENLTMKQQLMEAPGKSVLVKLKHQISDDGKRVFHRVESTARA